MTVPTEGDRPFACVVEKLPDAFPRQEKISEPVVFRGFFFKVIPYPAGNVRCEAAPLAGRLEILPERRLIGVPPGGHNERLPSASAVDSGHWLREDEIAIELVQQDRLLVDGKPIARDKLAPKLAVLGELHLPLNAQAAGLAIDSEQGLPAVIIFQASAETPFAAIAQIIETGNASRFCRFRMRMDQNNGVPQNAAPCAPAVGRPNAAELPETIRCVPISVWGDGTGLIGRVEIGENVLQGFAALERELGSMFTDPELPFDRAKVDAYPNLRDSEVVRLVDMLGRLNITQVSLTTADK